MNILIMGAPGSGKGTVSDLIKERFNLKHISTGDIFRKEIASGSAKGKIIADAIYKGNLAPSDILLDVMKEYLSREENRKNMLLDGFGKTLDEAKELDSFFTIDKVIWLDIEYETILKRILVRRICGDCGTITTIDNSPSGLCGKCNGKLILREDDNAETAKRRYDVFNTQTLPIKEYFEAKGMLRVVDARQPIEKVFEDVCKIIKDLDKNKQENSLNY